MPRKQVLMKVPEASVAAANAAFAAITGDDPEAISFTLNASLSGSAPATHAVGNQNVNASPGSSSSDGTKSEWQDWIDTLGTYDGSGALSYEATPAIDNWSIAESEWGLKLVS